MNLIEYIEKHAEWSRATFGEGTNTEGLCSHIEKELGEIRADPNDLMEWMDVIILAIDGAWRAGYSPVEITDALQSKQVINTAREWVVTGENEPNEHKRADCKHKQYEWIHEESGDYVCQNCGAVVASGPPCIFPDLDLPSAWDLNK